jgi:hypothetical protein
MMRMIIGSLLILFFLLTTVIYLIDPGPRKVSDEDAFYTTLIMFGLPGGLLFIYGARARYKSKRKNDGIRSSVSDSVAEDKTAGSERPIAGSSPRFRAVNIGVVFLSIVVITIVGINFMMPQPLLFGEKKVITVGGAGAIDTLKIPEFKETIYVSARTPTSSWLYFSYDPVTVGEWEYAFTDAKSFDEIKSLDSIPFYGSGDAREIREHIPHRTSRRSLNVEVDKSRGVFIAVPSERIGALSVSIGEVFLARPKGTTVPLIAIRYLEWIPTKNYRSGEGRAIFEYAIITAGDRPQEVKDKLTLTPPTTQLPSESTQSVIPKTKASEDSPPDHANRFLPKFTCTIECLGPLEQSNNKNIISGRQVSRETIGVKAYDQQDAEEKTRKAIPEICQERMPTYVDARSSCKQP